MALRLQTPEKIRTLQRKLYLKAKAEPDFRFYLLYDKVYREDILFHAYRLARSNKGAPGVDGQSFEEIEAMGLEGWLSGIRDDLRAKTYRPEPVRRAMVPKPGGGERPLGIPTIRDRVVQGAVKLVIEPIFEADLEPSAYGYRPKRSAGDAVQAVHKLLCRGYTDVVDADLSKYFDTIPHAELMQSVARRIVDRNVLRLIKSWLKTPVEETDGDGKRRMTGGRGSTRGTPQGGIVSLMLAAGIVTLTAWLRHGRCFSVSGCARYPTVVTRFPPVIIQHAVWLYCRFTLSYRDVEDLLAERGLDISYETVRRWVLKFGRAYARRIQRRRPRPTERWHLDEMVVVIRGRQFYLWRAVDSEGEVLDFLVQSRRNARAAIRLMRKLLKKQGFAPATIVTDKLRSYGTAIRLLALSRSA